MINFSEADFDKYFIKHKKSIGKGGFGNVYLATHKITQKKYALKEIEGIPDFTIEQLLNDYQKEFASPLIHDHPNLAKVYFAFKSTTFGGDDCVAILMEYLPKTLDQEIRDRMAIKNYFTP